MTILNAALSGLLAFTALSASTTDCRLGVVDVMNLSAGNTCTMPTEVGTQTFSGFGEVVSGLNSVVLGLVPEGSFVSGNDATLDFSVTTDPAKLTTPGAYVILTFEDQTNGAPLDQVSLDNLNGVGTVIYEGVCATPWKGNACPTGELAHLIGLPGLPVSAYFPSEQTIYIEKFIAFKDASITEFTDGYSAAPEPVTLAMIGMGLVALALRKRRLAE